MKLRHLATALALAAPALFLAPTSAAAATTTPNTAVKISIPMHAVAKKGRVLPQTVIEGNCGTAFLYASRVTRNEAHIDYGFSGLKHRAIYISAHAGMVNLDGAGTAHDSYSGPKAYVSSWERQKNLYPNNSGEYQVTAYIHSTGVIYDCVSSPNLITYVYLY